MLGTVKTKLNSASIMAGACFKEVTACLTCASTMVGCLELATLLAMSYDVVAIRWLALQKNCARDVSSWLAFTAHL